ncbi:hypothetical protein [Salinibacter ruber]|uniref:DUF481 domain-containing protein n=2 Tax=Salinibacter ruber TaxID=146919 RepID=A0A9X2UWN4_9BACT|nr:hypothetical protein [Salinibacter ruber]MCS3645233.1 hypothetical protein [Salinibacter ruber]MCS3645936.1 hypothetical protein [Salinibacter ruber]MCS3652734.1 hypothetical protein [Salinibacter ruber]MCS3656389.1 hypothetical protein [Salinibacter ruber]MCS3827153.1 hypothetical protein [Salinibacter ruber]
MPRPAMLPRPIRVLLLLGGLGLGLSPAPLHAQQVLVDDPTSVPRGAAQLEAWHSVEESWMAPALRVHPTLELAAGAAFLATGIEDRRTVEYSAEGKLLLRPGSAHRIGVAAVGGVGVRQLGVPRDRPASVYGYGVVSQDLGAGLTAYQNVGWVNEENGPHELTWGARLDWSPLDRATLIGEVYGEGRSNPSLQAVLRTVLLPDRIEMDVSVTRGGSVDGRSTWATLGFTFMSAPLYP